MLHVARVGSTNDVALALEVRGAPEGTLVVADEQLSGRGRRGRSWHSPGGGNLYCSLVLRPGRPQREWPELSWVVAGAVALAVGRLGISKVTLKHPNDVLVGGRKVAGVLLEARSAPGRAGGLVAGIGVNVARRPTEPSGGLRRPATSLAEELGGDVDRGAFLAGVCEALERLYAAWGMDGAPAALADLAASGVGASAIDAGPPEGEE